MVSECISVRAANPAWVLGGFWHLVAFYWFAQAEHGDNTSESRNKSVEAQQMTH